MSIHLAVIIPVVDNHVANDVGHLSGHLQQQGKECGHYLEQHLSQQWQLQTETNKTHVYENVAGEGGVVPI